MAYECGKESGPALHESEGFASQAEMDDWFRPLVKPGQTVEKTLMRFSSLNAISAYSRKDRAWKLYRASECFESDGKANAFSKGFDAGDVIAPHKWNDLLNERDHLLGAIRAIQRIWQTQSEACADNSRVAEVMADQARSATAYLDLPNQ